MRSLVVVAAVLGSNLAAAGPRTVAGFVLPTRDSDAPALTSLAGRLAAAVADRLHARVVAIPSSTDGNAHLSRAAALLLDAKLDEAALTYDSALEAADRDPAAYDAKSLIEAHIARVQIALARSEAPRATALLDRLYAWDATFAPTADEATPAIREAVERHSQPGARSRLDPAILGDSCRHADTTVVVRVSTSGVLEVARFDECTRVADVTASTIDDADHAVDSLAPRRQEQSRSILKRPWFWIALSSIAVTATGAAVWAETRDKGGLDVAIHF